MPQKRYKIVFSGRFVEGKDPDNALRRIASMFKVAPEKVSAAFAKGPGAVIVSTDDRAQAERYVAGLKKAGAICKVSTHQSQQPGPAKDSSSSSQEARSHKRRHPEHARPEHARVIETSIAPPDITLTTLVCTRLTGAQNGLDLNRQDSGRVEFADISLVAVYNSRDGSEDYRILFFLKGTKRPFGAECTSIAFGDFSGVRGKNLLSSLRNFLSFLYARNPDVIFDRSTYDFVAGGPMPLYAKDEIQLASSLYRAMPEDIRASAGGKGYGVARPEEGAAPEEFASIKGSSTKGACPKCGAPRKKEKPDCPRCGLIFVNWYKDKGKRRSALAKTVPLADTSLWSNRYSALAAAAILLGFALPMPKASLAFGVGDVIIWPWQMLGIGISALHSAAMATPQGNVAPLMWSLVLIISSAAALGFRRISSDAVRQWAWLLTGLLTLTLILIVFQKKGFILGSIFWPPSMTAGVIWTMGLLAAATVAAVNHVRKLQAFSGKLTGRISGRLRVLEGASAALLLLLSALMLSARPGPWGTWPVILAELLVISYAATAIYAASRPGSIESPGPSLGRLLSLLARLALLLLPLAGIIAQAYVSKGPSLIVVNPGGLWPASIAHIKAALILAGAASVFGTGLAGLLESWDGSPDN